LKISLNISTYLFYNRISKAKTLFNSTPSFDGKRIEENNAHPERRCVKDDGISHVSTITAQAEWMEV